MPEAAVANPGSSKITHEPLSSSLRRRATDGLSVVTLISVPARMLVAPVRVNSLPLRLRMTGGWGGPLVRPNTEAGPRRVAARPGPAGPGPVYAPGPAAAAMAGAAPAPGPAVATGAAAAVLASPGPPAPLKLRGGKTTPPPPPPS